MELLALSSEIVQLLAGLVAIILGIKHIRSDASDERIDRQNSHKDK